MKNNFFLLLVVMLIVSACATTRTPEETTDLRPRQSAGQIGCLPKDILIADDDGMSSWTATCKKKKFICTETISGGGSGVSATSVTSCKEELK